jgi:hypothetical protein
VHQPGLKRWQHAGAEVPALQPNLEVRLYLSLRRVEMRVWTLVAATLIAVPTLGIDRIVPTPLEAAQQAAGDAQQVLATVREALGGKKLDAVKTLTAEGAFRREMGQRQMEGTLALTLAAPDKMHRSEEMEMPGGASVERISVLAGDTSWDDTQNRGGMGGGMMVMRFRGPDGQEMNEEQIAQARTRRLKAEHQRWLLALLATAQDVAYAGTAESPDGKADVLEIKDDRGQAIRLFADQQTHLPLMMTFSEVRPRMMIGGPVGPGGPGGRGQGAGGQRPTPEQVEQMRARMREQGPPPPTTVTMRFDDYKSVDGVMLPHAIVQSVDGKPVEEWTVEKYKVNASVKADLFTKKQ